MIFNTGTISIKSYRSFDILGTSKNRFSPRLRTDVSICSLNMNCFRLTRRFSVHFPVFSRSLPFSSPLPLSQNSFKINQLPLYARFLSPMFALARLIPALRKNLPPSGLFREPLSACDTHPLSRGSCSPTLLCPSRVCILLSALLFLPLSCLRTSSLHPLPCNLTGKGEQIHFFAV